MFYRFVTAQQDWSGKFSSPNLQGSRKARHKLASACFRCRSYRIRCGQQTPCPQCVAAKAHCKRPDATRPAAKYPPQRRNKELGTTSYAPCSSENDSNPRTSGIPLASPVHSEARVRVSRPPAGETRTESLGYSLLGVTPATDFANTTAHTPLAAPRTSVPRCLSSQVIAFIESASRTIHQYPQERLEDPLYVDYDTPFTGYLTSSLESDAPPVTILSREEIDCFMEIFWRHLDVDIPILDRQAFQDHYESLWTSDGRQHTVSPLVDAVTAVSSQYAHGTDLIERILGLRHPRCTYRGDASLGAFCYLRRCRRMIDDIGTVAEPSLVTVQTYIFMTIYLLNCGQYQTAYTMVGLAIRIAHTLGLHEDHLQAPTSGDTEWRRRAWWTLVSLDLGCSTELGKPPAAHRSALGCYFPSAENRSSSYINLEYHVWSAKLTAAQLLVNDNLAGARICKSDANAGLTALSDKEMEAAFAPFEEWKKAIATSGEFAQMKLERPWAPDTNFPFMPMWLQKQVLKLALHYHDALNTLYRPFIVRSLSARLNHGGQTSHAEDCWAKRGLEHAVCVIDIIYDALRSSDLLYGQFELCALQWNAVLSFVAFVSAYPVAIEPSAAIDTIDRALLLFEMSENRYSVAMRASALCRNLRKSAERIIQGARTEIGHGQQNSFEVGPRQETSSWEDGQEEESEDIWSWIQGVETAPWDGAITGLEGSNK